MFERVLMLGVGLMGSSLALAIREHRLAKQIIGWSRSKETIETCLYKGIIDDGSTSLEGLVDGADLVVLSLPLRFYGDVARKISPLLRSNCIITDVGSAKARVVEQMHAGLSSKQQSLFVPGHPIAGSEKSGPDSGNAKLFLGKRVILTPTDQTHKPACQTIEQLWQAVGAEVEYMTPGKHDTIYAHVSHSMQFLAYAYRQAFQEETGNKDPGFSRFFRIANSNMSMWCDIFISNKEALLVALEKFRLAFLETLAQQADATDTALPHVIARSAIIMAQGYTKYAGTGFADFTSAANGELECRQTLRDVPSFLASFDTLIDALRRGRLESFLTETRT